MCPCPHNNNYISNDKFRTFGASKALGPQIKLPGGPNNCLDMLKKSGKSKLLMKKSFKFHAQPQTGVDYPRAPPVFHTLLETHPRTRGPRVRGSCL